DDHGAKPMLPRGVGDGLAVVAGGRGNHAGRARLAALQFVEIDEPPPDFESPDRSVILMLDPNLDAEPCFEQGPAVNRRLADMRTDQRRGRFDFGQGREWKRRFTACHRAQVMGHGSWTVKRERCPTKNEEAKRSSIAFRRQGGGAASLREEWESIWCIITVFIE